MSDAPESPARPDLTEQPTKPDVLVRLLSVRHLYATHPLVHDAASDAIDAITGLRETCERRLATIRDLQRELADARPEEGR